MIHQLLCLSRELITHLFFLKIIFFRYIYYLSPLILVQFCSCPTIIYSNRSFVHIKYQSFPTLVRFVPEEAHQQFVIERIFEKNFKKWWKGLEYHFPFNGKLIWGKIWINPVEYFIIIFFKLQD